MPKLKFEAIGTQWQLDYVVDATFKGRPLEIEDMIWRRVEEFDKTYSRFRDDSVVRQWARETGKYKLPADAAALFAFYKKLYDASGGLVTPLIGRTMEQAGYDAEYSLKPKKLSAPPTWEDALEITNAKIVVKQPVVFDFGAAGKGYLVDIIEHLLYTEAVDHFCIDAGGDILARNLPQTIGLEDPDDSERILGTVEIENGALCASAGNRRKWDTFHHIINPKTLTSPTKVKATWVKAENAMLADGIATALFFVAPERLLETFEFEYAMIVGDDMKISDNFKVKLFTN